MLPIGRGHDHLAEGFAGKLFEGWERNNFRLVVNSLPWDYFPLAFHTRTSELARQQHAD
jgi:hypothetical protein